MAADACVAAHPRSSRATPLAEADCLAPSRRLPISPPYRSSGPWNGIRCSSGSEELLESHCTGRATLPRSSQGNLGECTGVVRAIVRFLRGAGGFAHSHVADIPDKRCGLDTCWIGSTLGGRSISG